MKEMNFDESLKSSQGKCDDDGKQASKSEKEMFINRKFILLSIFFLLLCVCCSFIIPS